MNWGEVLIGFLGTLFFIAGVMGWSALYFRLRDNCKK
jgi:hypothetical protein